MTHIMKSISSAYDKSIKFVIEANIGKNETLVAERMTRRDAEKFADNLKKEHPRAKVEITPVWRFLSPS